MPPGVPESEWVLDGGVLFNLLVARSCGVLILFYVWKPEAYENVFFLQGNSDAHDLLLLPRFAICMDARKFGKSLVGLSDVAKHSPLHLYEFQSMVD